MAGQSGRLHAHGAIHGAPASALRHAYAYHGGHGRGAWKTGLSQSNFYAAQLHGKLAYHDFEGITVHADEGPRLLRASATSRR